jgi:DNA polymerase-1
MKTLLIDGTNCFIRNYTVNPALDSNGISIGGVYGFLISLASFIKLTKPNRIFICWDGPGGSKKRRNLIKDYKNNKRPKRLNRNYDFELYDSEDNKHYQHLKLIDYLKCLPVTQILIMDVEADDIVGYLCQIYEKNEKIIISGDRDFYQLIDNNTCIFRPKNKEFINIEKCYEEYKIYPHNFALAKAIVGDKSDNIVGIKGIGFKKLIKMFPQFSEKEKIDIGQLVIFAKEKDSKYNIFLNNIDTIITNLKAIKLDESLISFQSIQKIHKAIEHKPTLKITPLRLKLMEDGISDISDNFFNLFKSL